MKGDRRGIGGVGYVAKERFIRVTGSCHLLVEVVVVIVRSDGDFNMGDV